MQFAYSEKFYHYLESITISHNKFEDEKHIKDVLVYLKQHQMNIVIGILNY